VIKADKEAIPPIAEVKGDCKNLWR
jgi:hypothetical protein